MATFDVHVTIENKPGISDPEGETILNDLVLRGLHKSVTKIKTAKMLKFTITEKDKKIVEKAKKILVSDNELLKIKEKKTEVVDPEVFIKNLINL